MTADGSNKGIHLATVNRERLRFKWSHHRWIHRVATRIYNAVLRMVPFQLKYGWGQILRKRTYPYRLIRPGGVVVQVGAPQDTLLAARSRAMYFSLLCGPTGKVVVIEPDAASERQFRALAERHDLHNIIFRRMGVWNEKANLKLFVNRSHPATNFTEGTVHYDETRLKAYSTIEMPVDTLDNILDEQNIRNVDLVSITTNGSEKAILLGMRRTIQAGLPYICVARTSDDLSDTLGDLGYELFAHDDRGYTFRRVSSSIPARNDRFPTNVGGAD